MQSGYDSLVALPGVGVSLADALYERGFYSAEEISHATVEDLIQIRGIGEEKATKLIEASQLYIETNEPVKEAADSPEAQKAHEAHDDETIDIEKPSEPAASEEAEPDETN
jgi:N utilization substance protein A